MLERFRALDRRHWPSPLRKLLRPVARPVLRTAKRLEARRLHRATDAYMLSWPKAGRTWLRMLVGQALVLDRGIEDLFPTDLNAITRRLDDVPTVRVMHDDPSYASGAPRPYTRKRNFRDKDVVFVVRDPRDVVVSSYHHLSRRGLTTGGTEHRPVFEGTLEQFVHDERHGIRAVIGYMNAWHEARHVPRSFTVVRYEDLHADAAGELRRVLGALGIDGIDDATLARSVELSSFDRMREIERSGVAVPELRRPEVDDPDAYKVRKGAVGGFRVELDDELADELTAIVRDELSPAFRYHDLTR